MYQLYQLYRPRAAINSGDNNTRQNTCIIISGVIYISIRIRESPRIDLWGDRRSRLKLYSWYKYIKVKTDRKDRVYFNIDGTKRTVVMYMRAANFGLQVKVRALCHAFLRVRMKDDEHEDCNSFKLASVAVVRCV